MKNFLIITGGSRGIGKAIVEKYSQQNFKVFTISRNSLHDNLIPNVEHIQFDLINSDGIEEVLANIFLKIDKNITEKITLINNAATLADISRLEDNNIETMKQAISLNITAPMILSSLFIKHTKNWNSQKNIINISSGAAIKPYYGWTIYCSSKSALDMMTKVIAEEQKEIKNGAKVISIYPGSVDTEMQSKIRETKQPDFREVQRFINLKKDNALIKPETVAEKIYFVDNNRNVEDGAILLLRDL